MSPTAGDDALRIALLTYRGHPYVGGQGVYVRHLSRALVALGHEVTVFAGQPYPDLDAGIPLTKLPSLDLYNDTNPFRMVWPWQFRDRVDVREFAGMATGCFAEPMSFSLRARRELRARAGAFDVVHDNQCLGSGLLGIVKDGWPLVTSFHHPIAVDRRLDIRHARVHRKLSFVLWYRFLRMQHRVARQVPYVLTGSAVAKQDIVRECGVDPARMSIAHYGVDADVFRPRPDVVKVPGRMITTASVDVPLKGLVHLLEALAKVRTERRAELVILGKQRRDSLAQRTIDRLGLEGAVSFASGLEEPRLVELYASCELAVVPSLYEGFSLPAVEAMACGVPVVATSVGALPEIVGADGDGGLLVAPGDAQALAASIARALDSQELRAKMAARARARIEEAFTWRHTARKTVDVYREAIERPAGRAC